MHRWARHAAHRPPKPDLQLPLPPPRTSLGQVVLEVLESNVRRGSQVYEEGHVSPEGIGKIWGT